MADANTLCQVVLGQVGGYEDSDLGGRDENEAGCMLDQKEEEEKGRVMTILKGRGSERICMERRE